MHAGSARGRSRLCCRDLWSLAGGLTDRLLRLHPGRREPYRPHRGAAQPSSGLAVGAAALRHQHPDIAYPPENVSPESTSEQSPSAIGRQSRNGKLLRVMASSCSLVFSFVGVFSFGAYRLVEPPVKQNPTPTGFVFLPLRSTALFKAVGPFFGIRSSKYSRSR